SLVAPRSLGHVAKKESRIRVMAGDKLLGGFLIRTTTKGEIVMKPLTPGVRTHLSVHPDGVGGKLKRHVTHEEHPLGTNRRYTQKATFSPEEMTHSILLAIGPDGDPPPAISTFLDEKQRDAMREWSARVFPRMV